VAIKLTLPESWLANAHTRPPGTAAECGQGAVVRVSIETEPARGLRAREKTDCLSGLAFTDAKFNLMDFNLILIATVATAVGLAAMPVAAVLVASALLPRGHPTAGRLRLFARQVSLFALADFAVLSFTGAWPTSRKLRCIQARDATP
jgi:hypothetical protein